MNKIKSLYNNNTIQNQKNNKTNNIKMREITTTKLFLYTVFATVTIFALMKTDYSPNQLPNQIISRLLGKKSSSKSPEEILHDSCGKSPSNLESFYSENDPNYTFTPGEGDSFINELLKKLVNGKSKIELGFTEILQYGLRNFLYIVLLVLFVLLILFWIPYIFCACTRRCCCVSKSCSDKMKMLFCMAILFSGGVIACCVIGYTKNKNIIEGIYGLGCSVLKLEDHIVHGDEYVKQKPYWIGITPLVDKLTSTSYEIKDIGYKSKNIESSFNATEKLFNTFKDNLEKEYTDKKTKTISNPIPDETEKITPDYISKYGPQTDASTSLGTINVELTEFEKMSMPKLDKIVDVVDIEDIANRTASKISGIASDLNKVVNALEKGFISDIGEYYDKVDQYGSLVRKVMNIIFSFNLALAVAFVVFVILLISCQCGGCLLCILWFFIYILMLLSLLLCVVFGLVGSAIKDASSAVKFILKDLKDLRIISFDKNNLFDTCINGNGSLINSKLMPKDFNTSIIDNIYHLESNISQGINIIKSYNYLSIQSVDEIYNKVLKNPKNFVYKLTIALEQIKPYINSYVENTKVVTPINDTWVVNKEDCNNDYLPKTSLRNLILTDNVQSHCLVITEWSEEDIVNRYSNLEPIDSGVNIQETILKYQKSICLFMQENTALMNEIIGKNNIFNETFNEIKKSEIDLLNYVTETIKPLREIYQDTIASGSIFEILNCKFLSRDANKLVEVLYNEVGGSFKSTSFIFLGIVIIDIILTNFVLAILKALRRMQTRIPDRIENEVPERVQTEIPVIANYSPLENK